jgi:hypothetical protein
MFRSVVEFVVLGKIPFTNYSLGYRQSLLLAGIMCALLLGGLYAVLTQRRVVRAHIARTIANNQAQLITI